MSKHKSNNETRWVQSSTNRLRPGSERSYLLQERRYGYLAMRQSLRNLCRDARHLRSWKRLARHHPWMAVSSVVSLGAFTGSYLVSAKTGRGDAEQDHGMTCEVHQVRKGRTMSWLRSTLATAGRLIAHTLLSWFTAEVIIPSRSDAQIQQSRTIHDELENARGQA